MPKYSTLKSHKIFLCVDHVTTHCMICKFYIANFQGYSVLWVPQNHEILVPKGLGYAVVMCLICGVEIDHTTGIFKSINFGKCCLSEVSKQGSS